MSNVDRSRMNEIEEFLDSGITQTSVDGQSASFDLEFMQKRQRERKNHNPQVCDNPRPVMFSVRMRYQ